MNNRNDGQFYPSEKLREEIEKSSNWHEFKNNIDSVRNEMQEFEEKHKPLSFFTELLYRGQSNSEWPLESTWERKRGALPSVNDFMNQIRAITCNMPLEERRKIDDLPGELFDPSLLTRPCENAGWLSHCAYWRHEGEPSPLLDWTIDYNKSACFAFNDSKATYEDGRVAIFMLCPRISRTYNCLYPHIMEVGHFLQNSFSPERGWFCAVCDENEDASNGSIKHKQSCIQISSRYHRQEGRLSFCVKFSEQHKIWVFDRHSDCIENVSSNKKSILKFYINKTEKDKVLEELKGKGINYPWLMGEIDL